MIELEEMILIHSIIQHLNFVISSLLFLWRRMIPQNNPETHRVQMRRSAKNTNQKLINFQKEFWFALPEQLHFFAKYTFGFM